MMEREERASPRREEGERGRLEERWFFGGGLRSAAVVVEAEEEEGEGEWFVTGRRWKAIGDSDGWREGEGGLYTRSRIDEARRGIRIGNWRQARGARRRDSL